MLRLKIQELTANFFRCIIATTPEDLLPALYLTNNTVCPAFKGIELGVGDTLIMKAIQESTGRGKYAHCLHSSIVYSREQMKSIYKEKGDLGEIAMKSKSKQKLLFAPKPLTIRSLYKDFQQIASLEVFLATRISPSLGQQITE